MSENENKIFHPPGECLTEHVMFAYIDGRLSGRERNAVEKHMLECELCSDAMEGLQLLRNRERIPAVRSKANELILGRSKKEGKVIAFNFRNVTAIAASLVLLVGAVIFFKFITADKLSEQNVSMVTVQKNDESILNEETQASPPSENKPVAEIPVKEAEPAADDLEQSKTEEEKAISAGGSKGEGTVAITEIAPAADEAENKDNNVTLANSNQPVTTTGRTEELSEISMVLKKTETREVDASKNSGTVTDDLVDKTAASGKSLEKSSKEKLERSEPRKRTSDKKTNNQTAAPSEPEDQVAYAPASVKQDNLPESTTSAAETEVAGNVFSGLPETEAEFPGGKDSLKKYLSRINLIGYKVDAGATRIIISATIAENGTITNPQIIRSAGAEPDAEALRLIREMPKWKPAMRGGKPVPSTITIPILLEPR